ncbi:hypothetical protein DFAR_3850027 [Desulfarculales bacterium]
MLFEQAGDLVLRGPGPVQNGPRRGVKAVALNETASKRGYYYVIVFIYLDRKQKSRSL